MTDCGLQFVNTGEAQCLACRSAADRVDIALKSPRRLPLASKPAPLGAGRPHDSSPETG